MWKEILSDEEKYGASSRTSVAEVEGGKLIKTVLTGSEGMSVAQTFITRQKTSKRYSFKDVRDVLVSSVRDPQKLNRLPVQLQGHFATINTEDLSLFGTLLDHFSQEIIEMLEKDRQS